MPRRPTRIPSTHLGQNRIMQVKRAILVDQRAHTFKKQERGREKKRKGEELKYIHMLGPMTPSPPTHLGQNSITQIKQAIIIAERTPSTVFFLTLLIHAYMHMYIQVCVYVSERFWLRNRHPSIFFCRDPNAYNESSYVYAFIYICVRKSAGGIFVETGKPETFFLENPNESSYLCTFIYIRA